MVLKYRGVNVTVEEVARRVYDKRHDIFGNWPNAVQTAYSFGVPGLLMRFAGWDEVERMIEKGYPIIISLAAAKGELTNAPYDYSGGHLIVVTGFDKEGNVEVNDPALRKEEDGRLKYLRSELDEVWMKRKGGTAYVLLPKGASP